MGSVEGYLDRALEYDRLARQAAKPSDRIKFTNLAEYYRYMAREHGKSSRRVQLRTIHQQSVRAAPQVSDSASENARQRAAELREKAVAAEQRALSAVSPVERALYKAESANYQSLALEVEKLGHIAEHIDATTAAVIEETPPLVTKEKAAAKLLVCRTHRRPV